jgi:hypothetical protein
MKTQSLHNHTLVLKTLIQNYTVITRYLSLYLFYTTIMDVNDYSYQLPSPTSTQEASEIIDNLPHLYDNHLVMQARDYALAVLLASPDVGNADGIHSIVIPSPLKFPNTNRHIPVISPTPAPFDIVIHAVASEGDTSTYMIPVAPRAPNGKFCLLQQGLTMVIQPNFTIAWYLQSVQVMEDKVRYIGINDIMGVIRKFEIKKDWSVEGDQ